MLRRSDQLGAGGDLDVLIQDAVFELGADADLGVGHDDAVPDDRAGGDADAAEEDGVERLAEQHAAVGHDAVVDLAALAVVGRDLVADLGVDGQIVAEEAVADVAVDDGQVVAEVFLGGLVEQGDVVELKGVDAELAVGPVLQDKVPLEADAIVGASMRAYR